MSNKIGLITGSFDPITKGHLDIIERASRLFDQLYVGIFVNVDKAGFLPLEARERAVADSLAHLPSVRVFTTPSDLVVNVARDLGVTCLVRGLRNAEDLAYEASLDYFNHQLAPEIETIYLLAKPENHYISSSRVRELVHFGADISPYVPEAVVQEVARR